MILCDDIRNEVGSKTSLMGVYGNTILLPKLPFTLPKLCVLQRWQNLANSGTVHLVVQIPAISAITVTANYSSEEKIHPRSLPPHADFNFAVQNLTFTQEGLCKIFTYLKDTPTGDPDSVFEFLVEKQNPALV